MFSVGEIDVKGLQRFENLLDALGNKAPRAVNHALNRTGDMAKTRSSKRWPRKRDYSKRSSAIL